MSIAQAEDKPSCIPPSPIDVALVYSDRVNFAFQQNGIPLVSAVRLTACHSEPIDDVEIELSLGNGDAASWTGRVARLDPGTTALIEPHEFRLSAQTLATRTEAERTEIICRVSCPAGSSDRSLPIDLLAFDQWPGAGHYPEITAAFVTPNHPVVAELLGLARQAMRGLSGADALDGYQSGSRQRAAQLAEACFNAVASRGIGYINPPASFETSGQRVRLVDRIAREQFGTCLDLSLLIASAWEQCGLHPLILLPEGHAMPAIWTHDAHLPEAVIDEPATIRNLIELGEVVPVESTHITQSGASFQQAMEAAKARMRKPGATFLAIDIRSARKRGVRPLPLRVDGQAGVDLERLREGADPAAAGAAIDRVALAERAERGRTGDKVPGETPSQRIERWKTRLLDLSLRNRLLNFKTTGRALDLTIPSLSDVENALADGAAFSILPKSDPAEQFLKEELEAGHLHSAQSPAETDKRLLNLFRLARTSIEETGANVLYLALGFLKWYEVESSDSPRSAPLILLPITLHRSSAGSGYRYAISLNDEPLRPNVTLLEKLRVDFGIATDGLDRLPEDEHGLDVDLILRNIRAAIRNSPRWEVLESAALGLFSFNKFLMWKDLQENANRLKQNRLVGHLVDRPGHDFDPDPFPRPEDLDEQAKSDDLLCTRDADSSQLVAIRAAADGRTFVLEGPPGTGKSQTIANMVADSLARGKRVLFVAEKMAALTVVRKRLEQDGLGAFCLELHSAKASKKEVLAQLSESLLASTLRSSDGWDILRADLATARERLNTYVRELHAPRGTGESLYRMLGRLGRVGDGPTTLPPTTDPASATPDELAHWRRVIAELQKRGRAVDPPAAYPLRGIGGVEWSFALPQMASDSISNGTRTSKELLKVAAAFLRDGGSDFACDEPGRNGIHALAVVASLLARRAAPDRALFYGPHAAGLRRRAIELVAVGRQRDTIRAELLQRYREEFLDLEPLDHLDEITRHLKQHKLLRVFTAQRIRKSLRKYALSGLPSLDELASDLERLRELRRLTNSMNPESDLVDALGDQWNNGAASWDAIEEVCQWCEKLAKALAAIDADTAMPGCATRLADAASSPDGAARLRASGASLARAWVEWSNTWQSIERVLATNADHAFGDPSRQWLRQVGSTLQRWTDNLSSLNTWCAWHSARTEAVKCGLEPLVQLYERGGCPLSELEDVFWRSFGRAWFNTVADRVDAIRSFNADAHSDAIETFKTLDLRSIKQAQAVVAAHLAARAPATSSSASPQSELGILRRELEKKRRHLPTRRLIESMPTLLPRLKPCFLMSPLSVAQFLDSQLPPFDLVIFDEASQIPVWDAIGAMARGRDVIVVGDSKQLPPTSFFSTIDSDDEFEADDHAIDDMESILKECNASGISSMRLRWHYRSRHETLIAFSNHHYYNNELHTFPSPEERCEQLGVTFRHVPNAVYDRGGSRTSRIEAVLVADELVRMLRAQDADSDAERESIGVVTFSQAQQSLIEDLLDERRREHPEIERYFSSSVLEPVFVKNLENVQGDERDCIIFSIGYGRDQHGRMPMNFGPINRDGGERRLNVAVTRARRRLIVFSSITSDDIDLRRTQSVGVAHLKTFLDYAKRGPEALASVSLPTHRDFDSDFERAVCDALIELGWQVDCQVGCAGYRIDLAVRHPDKPGRYLLGVECDGAMYHSAKTARDRDRLRQSVLESLGWRIARVWSTEWQVDRRGCLAKLAHALEDEMSSPRTTAPAVPQPPDVQSPNLTPTQPQRIVDGPAYSPQPEVLPTPIASGPSTLPNQDLPPYIPAKITVGPLGDFGVYDPASTPHLITALGRIVAIESPVTKSLAMRRLADATGMQRIREQFRDRFDAVQSAAIRAGVIFARGDDLWSPVQASAEFTQFRVPSDLPDSHRDIEDIPLVELQNAVVHVLTCQFGLLRSDLIREVARLFGSRRTTSRMSDRIGNAVDNLIARGSAQSVDDIVRIATAHQ